MVVVELRRIDQPDVNPTASVGHCGFEAKVEWAPSNGGGVMEPAETLAQGGDHDAWPAKGETRPWLPGPSGGDQPVHGAVGADVDDVGHGQMDRGPRQSCRFGRA